MSNNVIEFPQQKDKTWNEIELYLEQIAIEYNVSKKVMNEVAINTKEYFYKYYKALKFHTLKLPKTISEDDKKDILTQINCFNEDINDQFNQFIMNIIIERCILDLELELAKIKLKNNRGD